MKFKVMTWSLALLQVMVSTAPSLANELLELTNIDIVSSSYNEIYQRPFIPYDYFIQDSEAWLWNLSKPGESPIRLFNPNINDYGVLVYDSYPHYDYLLFSKQDEKELYLIRLKNINDNSKYDVSEIYYAEDYSKPIAKHSTINIISRMYITDNGRLYGLAADVNSCSLGVCLSNLKVLSSQDKGESWDTLANLSIDQTDMLVDFFCNETGTIMYVWQFQFNRLGNCYYSYDSGVNFTEIEINNSDYYGPVVYPIYDAKAVLPELYLVDSLYIYKSNNVTTEPITVFTALPYLYSAMPLIQYFPDNSNNALYGNYLDSGYYVSNDKCANWQFNSYDFDYNYGTINPVSGTQKDIISSAQVYFSPETGTKIIVEEECFPTTAKKKTVVTTIDPFGLAYVLMGPSYTPNHGFSYKLKKYDFLNNSWSNAGWIDNQDVNDDLIRITDKGDLLVVMKEKTKSREHTSYIIHWSLNGEDWNTVDITNTAGVSSGDRDFVCGYYQDIPYVVIANYNDALWRVNLLNGEVQEYSFGDDAKRTDNRIIFQTKENLLFYCYANGTTNGKSFVSYDFGLTWQDMQMEKVDNRIRNVIYIAVNPLDTQNYLALVKLSISTNFRILETLDGGISWNEDLNLDTLGLWLSNNMWTRTTKIVPVIQNGNVKWYINVDSIIVVRTSNNNWEKVLLEENGVSLKVGSIESFYINPNNTEQVIIKNEAGKLYRGSLINSIHENLIEHKLKVNYTLSTVYFTLSSNFTKLSIFDINGGKLASLKIVSESNWLSWQGTDSHGNQLPSGIYFARAEDEHGNVATAKVVLVR